MGQELSNEQKTILASVELRKLKKKEKERERKRKKKKWKLNRV